jgi:uncharacterized membrane protein
MDYVIEALFLCVSVAICSAGCWLTFSEKSEHWWFLPFGTFLGGLHASVWYISVRLFGDKDRIYIFNILWDASVMATYYGMPIFTGQIKLDRQTAIGLGLIVAGAVTVRIGK